MRESRGLIVGFWHCALLVSIFGNICVVYFLRTTVKRYGKRRLAMNDRHAARI